MCVRTTVVSGGLLIRIDALDFAFDPELRVARGPAGTVQLSGREADVLAVLSAAGGEPVARSELADRVGAGSERAVDFAVCRLRRKIERDPGDPRIVQTVHGHGYRLAVGGSAPPPPVAPRALVALGDREIDLDFGTVHLLGDEIPLSPVQRLVLEHLLDAGGRLVTRDALARALRESGRTVSVERAVSALRSILEPVPAAPIFVLTDPGGWRLRLERPTHNLGPLRPLLGRTGDLAALVALAESPGWIEVLGPVGVGKSLLAKHACQALADRLAGGGWWVDCGALGTAPEVARAAEVALGVDASSGIRSLQATLRSRGPVALVLDGLDPGCAELAGALVRHGVRLLTTSTRRLSPTSRTLRLGGLAPAEGRALYLRKAREIGVEPRDGPSIDALVTAFDGLPLAIELAASFAAGLPSDRLLGDDALGALEAFGGRISLLAAIERAWRSCGADLRRALLNLSCFRGPFSPDDAAAVAHVTEATLADLGDRSLLAPEQGFYRMLGVLRQFLLQVGRPSPEVVDRHQRRRVEQARIWGDDPPHRSEVERASGDLLAIGAALAKVRPADASVVAHALACCQHRPSPPVRALVEGLLDDPHGSPALWLDCFQWRRLEGDLVGAEAAIDAAVDAGQDPASWLVRYARIIVAVERVGLERVDLGDEPHGPLPAARWMMVRGRALVQTGELLRGYGLLLRARDLCSAHGFVVASLGAERHLAEALAFLGSPSDLVARRLERTLLGLEAMGCWSSAVPCALQAAVHRSTVGRASQARVLVARARRIAADLDLPRDESRARTVLLRIGLADEVPGEVVRQARDLAAFAASIDHPHGLWVARYAEGVGLARGGDRDGALALTVEIPEACDPLVRVGLESLAAVLDPTRSLPSAPTQRHWARSTALVAARFRTGVPLRDRHAKRDAVSNPMVLGLVRAGGR